MEACCSYFEARVKPARPLSPKSLADRRSHSFDLISWMIFTDSQADQGKPASVCKANQGKYILIDEVQKYPPATATIKYLYDNFKTDNLKFVLTGSSVNPRFVRVLGIPLLVSLWVRLYPLSVTEIKISPVV